MVAPRSGREGCVDCAPSFSLPCDTVLSLVLFSVHIVHTQPQSATMGNRVARAFGRDSVYAVEEEDQNLFRKCVAVACPCVSSASVCLSLWVSLSVPACVCVCPSVCEGACNRVSGSPSKRPVTVVPCVCLLARVLVHVCAYLYVIGWVGGGCTSVLASVHSCACACEVCVGMATCRCEHSDCVKTNTVWKRWTECVCFFLLCSFVCVCSVCVFSFLSLSLSVSLSLSLSLSLCHHLSLSLSLSLSVCVCPVGRVPVWKTPWSERDPSCR